jgi:acetyltransferase-like isoleucine patch superfamily enzyme
MADHAPRRITPRSLLIVGAGGHARVLIDLLDASGQYDVVGLVDSHLPAGSLVNGFPVLGPDSSEHLQSLAAQGIELATNAVGGINDRALRSSVCSRIQSAGFLLPVLVHPSATVDRSAHLGAGTQVLAGAYVGAGAQIGADCIVNTHAVVSHDCVLGDHVTVSPGAMLAGGVRVGANTLIGMGATVYLGLTIGSRVVVANGAAVFADVADDAVIRHR